jgi:Fe2+ or Zn2+ uptake regulation protein
MPTKITNVPDDLQHLFPLTPAVFFILFALAEGEKHGYAIMQQVAILSDGQFRMGPATLYTTIQRLLELSLIEETATEAGGRIVFKAELARMDAVVKLAAKQKLAPQGGS